MLILSIYTLWTFAMTADPTHFVEFDLPGAGQPCIYPMVSTTNRGTTSPIAANDAYTDSGASVVLVSWKSQ